MSLPDEGMAEAFAWAGKRVLLVINCGSGKGARCGEVAEALREALERRGAEVSGDAGAMGEQIAAMQREPALDVIVAIGGDGTVSAAGAAAEASGAALLVLAMGTMNLVARDLDLPEPDALIESLDRLCVRRIDTAEVGGHVYLHSALIGVVPTMAEHREGLRTEPTAGGRLASLVRFVRAAFDSPALRLKIASDRGSARVRTRCLAVTCNPMAVGGFGEHRRATLEGGVLGVYASRHAGALAPLELLTTLATGTIARDGGMDAACAGRLEVRAARRSLAVSIDGEVRSLAVPLRFAIRPRALVVLVPRAVGEGA
ncbi:MAG: hypothetical protein KF757_02700 [Phycisphaeraceae bacterium]|nr:hypothetical protein [Phycisphaeraceae bacterium]MCW5764281.1 hypothetical protein [Phycisphaeraceae bacterium]